MTTFTRIPKQVEKVLGAQTTTTSRRSFLKNSGLLVVGISAAAVPADTDKKLAFLNNVPGEGESLVDYVLKQLAWLHCAMNGLEFPGAQTAKQ